MSNWTPTPSSPEEVRRVRLMIRAYLGMRDCEVPREEILRVAGSAGIKKGVIYDTLRYISDGKDYEDVDVANWWGFETTKTTILGITPAHGKKTAWFRLYQMEPEEKRQRMADAKWFDELEDNFN